MSTIGARSVGKATLSGTAAATGTITIPPGKAYTSLAFKVSGLTTETVGVSFSIDQTNFSGACKAYDATSGALTANATLGNGYYYLPYCIPACAIKFTKSSTSETLTLDYLLTF